MEYTHSVDKFDCCATREYTPVDYFGVLVNGSPAIAVSGQSSSSGSDGMGCISEDVGCVPSSSLSFSISDGVQFSVVIPSSFISSLDTFCGLYLQRCVFGMSDVSVSDESYRLMYTGFAIGLWESCMSATFNVSLLREVADGVLNHICFFGLGFSSGVTFTMCTGIGSH